MRILVTGAEGFVGSLLTSSLAADGHEVFGTSRRGTRGRLACDLRDAVAVEEAVRKSAPERVFHLAAQSSAALSWSDPALTYAVNVTGTHLLLDSIRRLSPGARVLLACTSDQYGAVTPERCPIDEQTPLRPVSPYAVSKVAQEWVGRMFANAFGMEVVATRAFMHIGPGQPPRFALADWARQIALIEEGDRDPVIRVGNLDLRRELGDVRDVIDAYRAALESGEPGEAYNVATGEALPLREALGVMLSLARVDVEVRVDAGRIRPADPPVLEGDASKLEDLTGWAPKHRFDETLSEVLEHWRGRVAAGAEG